MIPLPIAPILVQPDGSFRCADTGRLIVFGDGNGDPVQITNMPEGSWPFAYENDGASGAVYFSYFLSSVVHRWRLGPDHTRQTGETVARYEIEPCLRGWAKNHPNQPDAAWLCMKLLDDVLAPYALGHGELTCFAELERQAACITLQGRGHHATARFVKVLVELAGKHRVAPTTLLGWTKVPDGYFNAVKIVAQADSTDDDPPTNSFSFDRLAVLKLKNFLADINTAPDETGMAFEVEGLVDRHLGHVTVTFRHLDLVGYKSKICSIELPLHLFINTTTAYPDRVRQSLIHIHPFLVRFFGTQPENTSLAFDFSDVTTAGHIGFDRRKGMEVTLLPDLYLLLASLRNLQYHTPPFCEFTAMFISRPCVAFWRGSATGNGGMEISSIDDFIANRRVQGCLTLAQLPHRRGDGKITQVVQTCSPDVKAQAETFLTENYISGTIVAEQRFSSFQMYIDFPGNASAWGSFRKYLMGCLVLRPEHECELIYDNYLESGIHYLPIRADLGDISDVTTWVANNPQSAARIAYQGRLRMIEIIGMIPALIEQTFAHGAKERQF